MGITTGAVSLPKPSTTVAVFISASFRLVVSICTSSDSSVAPFHSVRDSETRVMQLEHILHVVV
jgi:hypothetical protein